MCWISFIGYLDLFRISTIRFSHLFQKALQQVVIAVDQPRLDLHPDADIFPEVLNPRTMLNC